jgi:DNA-binding beta-propeller fold protein YncE
MMRDAGAIDVPPSNGPGGFDHAAILRRRGLLYVAHTANDAVDVIDIGASRYLRSIPGLKGVAGALVDEAHDLVFTSNRGEDTVGIFASDAEPALVKVGVGVRPNGLALAPDPGVLLCANVGDPSVAGSHTVSLVDVRDRAMVASVPVPGRTRWTVFDPVRGVFFVNIADPPEIVWIDPLARAVVGRFAVPDRGPHGLDIDVARRRLYCACDGGALVALDADTGDVRGTLELSGAPDVIFLDHELERLYVAVGDPGVVDVVDTAGWRRVETVSTERGAHTLALDTAAHRIYVFLPATHRVSMFDSIPGWARV